MTPMAAPVETLLGASGLRWCLRSLDAGWLGMEGSWYGKDVWPALCSSVTRWDTTLLAGPFKAARARWSRRIVGIVGLIRRARPNFIRTGAGRFVVTNPSPRE